MSILAVLRNMEQEKFDRLLSVLYLGAFGIYQLGFMTERSALPIPVNVIRLSLALLLLLVLHEALWLARGGRYQPQHYLSLAAILCLTLISNRIDTGTIIVPLLLIFEAWHHPWKQVVKFVLAVSAAFCSILWILTMLGMVENYTYFGTHRVAMGYNYVLFMGMHFFNIVSLICILMREKIKYWMIVILQLINIYIYVKTEDDLSFGLTTILLAVILLWRIGFLKKLEESVPDVIRKLWDAVQVFSIPLGMILSVIMTICYTPNIEWMNRMNIWMQGRLGLQTDAWHNYGVTFWGQEVYWMGALREGETSDIAYNYVDNLFMRTLFQQGILYALIIAALMLWAMWYFSKKDKFILFLFAMLAAHMLFDDLVLWLFFNTLWIFVSYAVNGYEKDEREKVLPSDSESV